MDELVQWLRDRLDEDEQAANDAGGKPWAWEQHYGDMCNDPTCEYGELSTDDTVLMQVHGYDITEPWQGAAHIERYHPACILAEIDAKRRRTNILADAIERGHDDSDIATELLSLEALPYADRPGYREEWRP